MIVQRLLKLHVTVLVVIGAKEQDEFDKLFPTLSKEIQEIYNTTKESSNQIEIIEYKTHYPLCHILFNEAIFQKSYDYIVKENCKGF